MVWGVNVGWSIEGRVLKAWALKGKFEKKGKEEARNTERIAEAGMLTGHIWAHVHCGTIVLTGILRKKRYCAPRRKAFSLKSLFPTFLQWMWGSVFWLRIY